MKSVTIRIILNEANERENGKNNFFQRRDTLMLNDEVVMLFEMKVAHLRWAEMRRGTFWSNKQQQQRKFGKKKRIVRERVHWWCWSGGRMSGVWFRYEPTYIGARHTQKEEGPMATEYILQSGKRSKLSRQVTWQVVGPSGSSVIQEGGQNFYRREEWLTHTPQRSCGRRRSLFVWLSRSECDVTSHSHRVTCDFPALALRGHPNVAEFRTGIFDQVRNPKKKCHTLTQLQLPVKALELDQIWKSAVVKMSLSRQRK